MGDDDTLMDVVKEHIEGNWNATTAKIAAPTVVSRFREKDTAPTRGSDRIVVYPIHEDKETGEFGDDYTIPWYTGPIRVFAHPSTSTASGATAANRYRDEVVRIVETLSWTAGIAKGRITHVDASFYGDAPLEHKQYKYDLIIKLRCGPTVSGLGTQGSALVSPAEYDDLYGFPYVTYTANTSLTNERVWSLSADDTHSASCTFSNTVHFTQDVVFTKTVSVEEVIIGTPTFAETATFSDHVDMDSTVTIDGTATFNGAISGVSHTELDDIGTNTHAQIDTHISDASDPHGVTLTQTRIITTTATLTNATIAALEVGTLSGVALADLSNVTSHAPEAGEVLTYNSTTADWGPVAGGGGGVSGSGTQNYIAKWSAGTALTDSSITDDGDTVTFSTTVDFGDKNLTNVRYIKNDGAIDILPSGETDDYFQFGVASGIPFISIIGYSSLELRSDDTTWAQINLTDGSANDFFVGMNKSGSPYARLYSSSYITMMPNADTDDYLKVWTSTNVPYIDAIGACGLKLAADGTPAIVVDASGNVTKIGQTAPATSKYLTWDGDSWEPTARKFSVGACVLNATTGYNTVWRAPIACTVTEIQGRQKGGTSTVINARKSGSTDVLSSDLTLTSANTWYSSTSVQNTDWSVDDWLEVEVVTTGGATEITIQVEFTEP